MKTLSVSLKSKAFEYDFAVDGGAIGAINTGVYMPPNSLITRVLINVKTNFTSGGSATLAIKAGALTIVPATGYASLPGTTNPGLGLLQPSYTLTADLITGAVTGPINDEAVFISATPAQSQLTLVIAGATLTAGKAIFIVEYYENPE